MAGIGDLEYELRLRELCLYSLNKILLRMNLIKMWMIFHRRLYLGVSQLFERAQIGGIRGHYEALYPVLSL